MEQVPLRFLQDNATSSSEEPRTAVDTILMVAAIVAAILFVLGCAWRMMHCFDGDAPTEEEQGEDALPSYWVNKKAKSRFNQLFYLSQEDYPTFDELLSSSYLPYCTEDRPRPENGAPELPTGYVAQCVMRVEDFDMWERYKQRRKAIQAASKAKDKEVPRLDIPALTDEIADRYPKLFQPLSDEINEVYLWYGKSVPAALSLMHAPLELDPASGSGNAAFSRRARCAESITQADECGVAADSGHYQDLFAILLCRVCMGKMYQTHQRDELACGKVAGSLAFDSTLGNKTSNTFREFIVYSAEQIYPEYVVLYRRLYKGQDAEQVRQALPFYTQLPLYWKNCFRNPLTDPFSNRHVVCSGPKAFLEAFVSKNSGKKLTLVSAARIENSDAWMRYMSFREKLVCRFQAPDGAAATTCKSPAELDGKKNKGLTVRERLDEIRRAQVLSLEEFNWSVNELVLWHSTSLQKVAAEKEGDVLQIATGQSFGKGMYFAEELDRALSYATQDYHQHQWVLLCRVLVGDMHLVTGKSHPDAPVEAAAAGKDTVLASRSGRPREFVVSGHQVYPEYVLELKTV